MTPKRYRKRPVVIEAIQLTDEADWHAIAAWCGGSVELARDHTDEYESWICIPTLEGDMRASAGDWIIRGVADEFYPCKPDIFTRTYEEVQP